MLKLIFCPEKISRKTTRQEWRKIWHWKRLKEKELNETEQKLLEDFRLHGATWAKHIQQDFLDKIINPPLLIYPDFNPYNLVLHSGHTYR